MRLRFALAAILFTAAMSSPVAAFGTTTATATVAPLGTRVPAGVVGLGVLGVTNEEWQHTSYVVTGDSSSWYGASTDVKMSGLWLDGWDDQHEVSLTIYADRRYGETGNGYDLCSTYAIALMRNDRERLSFALHPDPDHIDIITLSTCTPADEDDNRYIYPKDSAGNTMTVGVDQTHNLTAHYAGESTYVYNDDSLAGKPAVCRIVTTTQTVDGTPTAVTERVPIRTDWEDLTDSSAVAGHMVYKWNMYLDGKVVDSSWMDSPTGRVKIESNKRHLALATSGSHTYFTNVRLGQYSPASSWQPWGSSVPTIIHNTRGLYRWSVGSPYTSLSAFVPGQGAKPNYVLYTNPVAYDIKSLQTTRFICSVPSANMWATLVVRCPTGVKTIYNGPIAAANTNFYFPLWNGLGPDGKKLPAASYYWELTLSKGDGVSFTSGKITVSTIYFKMTGSSAGGSVRSHTAYMVRGAANCYITATAAATGDRLGTSVTGAGGYHASVGSFAFGSGTSLSTTAYLHGPAQVPVSGLATFRVTGAGSVSYAITVIQ